ncbi:MAG: hypothetical protein Q8S73_06685 [Deltaproteobacteria bacterium]|nr:hypothetical protein [Myxococcales bacterium]MDP3213770.1 hypothetical protein [Deltaproteobacteria bacterium]
MSSHEFSAAENLRFAALAQRLRLTTWLLLTLAALVVALSAEAIHSLWWAGPAGARFGILALAGLVLAMVLSVLARWIHRAASSFRAVVDTAGADVTHAMTAVRALGRSLRVLEAAAVASLALTAVAVVAHLR